MTDAHDPSRLETLEFKLAHLERALQELSEVLYAQAQRLEAAVGRQGDRLDGLAAVEPGGEPAPTFEIPPHY